MIKIVSNARNDDATDNIMTIETAVELCWGNPQYVPELKIIKLEAFQRQLAAYSLSAHDQTKKRFSALTKKIRGYLTELEKERNQKAATL